MGSRLHVSAESSGCQAKCCYSARGEGWVAPECRARGREGASFRPRVAAVALAHNRRSDVRGKRRKATISLLGKCGKHQEIRRSLPTNYLSPGQFGGGGRDTSLLTRSPAINYFSLRFFACANWFAFQLRESQMAWCFSPEPSSSPAALHVRS